MKRSNLEKQLKTEAEKNSPDPFDKILLAARAENLLPEDGAQDVTVSGSQSSAVKAKNRGGLFAGLGAAIAAAAVGVVLLLTLLLKGATGGVPVVPDPIKMSSNDVYGMGAVSTVKLLGSNLSASAVKSLSAVSEIQSDGLDVKSQAEKFNEYFTALDSFLGEDIVTTTTVQNTDANYPFDYKMTISGKELDGETVVYTMYYSETLSNGKVDFDDDDDDEEEKTYTLEGVMVVDGADYFLEGARSVEQEKGESESELQIRAYADKTDRKNYIQMEQEYSEEAHETENEYVYSVYSNGKLVEQTAVEFETERKNNKTETEYELEFRKGGAKGRYKVEREVKNNVTVMKVKYNLGGESGEFRISENGGIYEYKFSDGTKLSFKK